MFRGFVQHEVGGDQAVDQEVNRRAEIDGLAVQVERHKGNVPHRQESHLKFESLGDSIQQGRKSRRITNLPNSAR